MSGYGWLQLVSVLFLVAGIFFLYMFANSTIMRELMVSVCGRCLVFAGGLCLEVYLSHRVLLSDGLNGIFPINILILFAGILLVAYGVRVVTRLLLQTFSERENYEWRKILL